MNFRSTSSGIFTERLWGIGKPRGQLRAKDRASAASTRFSETKSEAYDPVFKYAWVAFAFTAFFSLLGERPK